MNAFTFHPWLLFYPGAAIASIILSIQILKGKPKTLSSKNFILFTISISLWEILIFLHRIAPNKEVSLIFLQFATIFCSLNPLLLLMTVLFLWKENPKFYLLMIPMIPLYLLYFMYVKIDIVPTSYGWSYRLEMNIFAIIEYLIYLFSLVQVCFFVVFLIKRIKSSIIRRKYFIILAYFVIFYIFGVFGMNILLANNPEMPPPGGINTFLFFVGVSYAFSIGEKTVLKPREEEITDLFLKHYTSFIKKFIETAPGKELGQNLIELEKYLSRIGLSNALEYNSKEKLLLKKGSLDDVDLISLIDETLHYLNERPWAIELADSFLPILTIVYMKINNRDVFKRIIISHEDFLKKTDIIYGLAGGEFLSEIESDNSLKGLPDWQACLRLCRRLVSVILKDFYDNIGNVVESKILSFSLLNRLRISNLGGVDTKGIEEIVKAVPPHERISILLENFIPFIAWMIEELYKIMEERIEGIIKRVRTTLRLNIDIAMRTMVYSSLIESLSARIPSTYVSMLKLAEGYTEADLNKFSSRIGLDHGKLIGRSILLEFEPGSPYLDYVRDYVIESLAHADTSIIITRKGSSLQDKLQDQRNIKFIYPSLMTLHTTVLSESEVQVSLQDINEVLEALGRSIRSSPSPVFVVFDSITDFLTQHGFEKTYRLIRSMIELNPSKVSLMVTLNIKAWGENIRSALEELLNITIRVD